MFSKVIIAEDMDDANKGVLTTLQEFGIDEVYQVQYGDDAYLRIKRAQQDGIPYDLLITDLGFTAEDHRPQKYPSGEDLIDAVAKEFPDLKMIVYSVENKLQKVRSLVKGGKIRAYVCKGRHGLTELVDAIKSVDNGIMYLSPSISQAMHAQHDMKIDDYDIMLIRQLSKGQLQSEISDYLEEHHIKPSSLSSVEKRINKLKDMFKANNPAHLVAIAKDLGLI